MPAPFVGALVSFVIALLVGGLAIYVSARAVVDVDDFEHALVTAALGALAWGLTAWVPLLGPLLALVVWVGVIRWRYPGGWGTAALIGLGAWLIALLVLFVVNTIFQLGIGAVGVPGL